MANKFKAITKENFISILDKDWDEYDKKLIEILIIRKQCDLFQIISTMQFTDFPKNMPPEIMAPAFLKYAMVFEDEATRRKMEDPDIPGFKAWKQTLKNIPKFELTDSQNKILDLFNAIQIESRYLLKLPEMRYPDFISIIQYQEVIMICCLAEEFISESILISLKKTHNTLSHKKINALVFKLSYGNILKKIKNINRYFNLKIEIEDDNKNNVEKLIKIRNLITHNGSRIDQEYLTIFKEAKFKINDKLTINPKEMEDFFDSLGDVLYILYFHVKKHILCSKEEDILPRPNIFKKM